MITKIENFYFMFSCYASFAIHNLLVFLLCVLRIGGCLGKIYLPWHLILTTVRKHEIGSELAAKTNK